MTLATIIALVSALIALGTAAYDAWTLVAPWLLPLLGSLS
jgi:hypothetical protein